MQSNRAMVKFSTLYFFVYSGIGAFLPLLSLYLEASAGLTGVQIGSISALGSMVGIFAGPLWGIVSDRYNRHKAVLIALMAGGILVSLVIPFVHGYPALLAMFFLFYLFISPLNPLVDGIGLHSGLPFGSIRLWGSIGFALFAFITGYLAERLTMNVIFYILIAMLAFAMLTLQRIRMQIGAGDGLDFGQLRLLLSNRRFLVFLIYCMLISSTFTGNNTYFGLYYKSIGGDVAMVGLAFLLFAISEVPFMQWTAKYLKSHPPYKMLAITPLLGILRWGIYALAPSPMVILGTFFLQGLFFTPMLVGYAEFIRLELPVNLRTTGVTLYTATSFGMGAMIINFVSGWIYDHYPAQVIFIFYSLTCLLSLTLVPYLFGSRAHSKGL